jgi:hypothetical protein
MTSIATSLGTSESRIPARRSPTAPNESVHRSWCGAQTLGPASARDREIDEQVAGSGNSRPSL